MCSNLAHVKGKLYPWTRYSANPSSSHAVQAEARERVNCPTCRKAVSREYPTIDAHLVDNVVAKWIEQKKNLQDAWDGMEEWEERSESVI